MEPEKKYPVLNDEQKAAAYCVKNAVVAAGAGSGKTLVLASRFTWLVTEKNYHVREILTLTFTKKATAQMYQRIYRLLAEIAREDSGEKGRRAKQALDEFAQARIQTLDSYSASIVRQAANRYGISPDFTIDENQCRQLAFDEALPFFIANRGHPVVRQLYAQRSPLSIVKNIFAPALFNFTAIDLPVDPKRDINAQFSVICAEWERQRNIINKKIHELAEAYAENEKCHPDIAPLLRQYETDNTIFPDGRTLRDFFNELAAVPYNSVTGRAVVDHAESHPLRKKMLAALGFFAALCNLDLRKGSPRENPAKALIKEFKLFLGEFSSLVVFCVQAGYICSALTLFHALQRRYLDRKRAEGVLTFTDVARLARTILMEQHDIRQSEKESFKAIMIDEFQDNNELQKDLLFLLAEKPEITHNSLSSERLSSESLSPEKLFFVGDEKQSIYRFRGADVSVFRALKKELGSADLPLKTNYRSAPLLIGAFNAIFGGSGFTEEGESGAAVYPAVFAPEPSSALPLFEASFSPLRAGREGKGKLTLCILDKGTAHEAETGRLRPEENEARYIAERIHSLLREKNESGEAKYQPDDIAILFRSRSPQHLFEKHLMLLNIPFVSEDLNDFFYGGPVNDMLSVLRLAAYPTDKAAYAQMLRSPFAGLSLPGLAVCLAVLDDQDSPVPFGDEPLSLLDGEDREKYSHGQRIYQKIRDNTCTESVSSLVSELWYGEGYRYETEWNPKTAAYREMYDYLFHLAAQADEKNQGLAAFTDTMQTLYNTGERLSDIEIPLERSGARASAIHLMTIHKSKGLEFPVVFLCCCDKHGIWKGSDIIFDTDDAGITINPSPPPECSNIKNIKYNYFWERSLAIERKKRTAELRRLLYVGMTRAEQELFLSGCINVSGKETADVTADNFSLNLKRSINAQTAAAVEKNSIAGDAIIDNDTFFGLCLPSLGAHISDTPADTFFTVEEIPAYSEDYIREAEQHGSIFTNDQKGLNAFFKEIGPYYQCEHIMKTPVVPKRYCTPVSLSLEEKMLPGSFAINGEYSGNTASDVFGKVDALLDRYAKQYGEDGEKFNSGGFGTIAHICVEALLSNQEAVIPPKLAGFLNSVDADTFLEAGKELALRFTRSPLGIIAKESEKRKTEFPFRSLIYTDGNESFINGTIDLIFEDNQTVYVVDFKTDSQELPGIHIPQMACYYRAASDLFAVPSNKVCTTWLYYLRSGHAINITEQVRDFNLGKALGKRGF